MWNMNPSDGIVASSPVVFPQFTNRPWGLRANIDWAHSAGPTWSNTMSTPGPPVTSWAHPVTSPVRLFRTWSAPSARALSSFSSEPAVASTVAPTYLANWIAATLTPLPAAWINTVSPADREPTVNRPCHAVNHAVGNDAALSYDIPAGIGYTCVSGARHSSA